MRMREGVLNLECSQMLWHIFQNIVFGFLQTAHVLQIAVIHPEPFCITGKSRRHQNDKFF